MAALLLGERVVTMMPAPLTDFGQVELHAAVRSSPRYMRFIESWSWSLPLWREGVIASAWRGDDPAEDVRHACRAIEERHEFEPLRPLMRRTLFEDQREYLDLLAADLLKGGPDPGISVPMAAGLDRFASRHQLMSVRSEPVSVAQRAEIRCGVPAFALAVPILLQAGGETILRARRALGRELEALRGSVRAAAQGVLASGEVDSGALGALHSAASEFSARFEENRPELCRTPRDEERVVDGFVTITAYSMPCELALVASLAAVRLLGAVTGAGNPGTVREPELSTVPVVRDPLIGRRFVALVVKVMGRSHEPRRFS